MNRLFRHLFGIFCLVTLTVPVHAESEKLTFFVLQNSPLMSFHNDSGELVGFNVDVGRALCAIMKVQCQIKETTLANMVDQIASGEGDFGVASLSVTPERSKKVGFTIPYFREGTFWVSRTPMDKSKGIKVATVSGSTQSKWVTQRSAEMAWNIVTAKANADLPDILLTDKAEAAIAPISPAINMMRNDKLREKGFIVSAINAPELAGPTSIAVNPAKLKLREQLDAAIQEISNNGQLDRLNSKYFPFRMF